MYHFGSKWHSFLLRSFWFGISSIYLALHFQRCHSVSIAFTAVCFFTWTHVALHSDFLHSLYDLILLGFHFQHLLSRGAEPCSASVSHAVGQAVLGFCTSIERRPASLHLLGPIPFFFLFA